MSPFRALNLAISLCDSHMHELQLAAGRTRSADERQGFINSVEKYRQANLTLTSLKWDNFEETEESPAALSHGNGKYGAWNWRLTHVEMMTYLGAMKRHIDAVIAGQDTDPESGAHHLGHVAASCAIVLDARQQGTLIDNRPPHSPSQNPTQPSK